MSDDTPSKPSEPTELRDQLGHPINKPVRVAVLNHRLSLALAVASMPLQVVTGQDTEVIKPDRMEGMRMPKIWGDNSPKPGAHYSPRSAAVPALQREIAEHNAKVEAQRRAKKARRGR